jgi:enoyl-CoA hydratase
LSHRVEDIDEGMRVVLDRPPVNALDLDAVRALEGAFREVADAPGVLLAAEGRAFSAGVDTRWFDAADASDREALVLGITRMVAALCAVRGPVVAQLQGHALGGGLVLALCADWRVAVVDEGVRLGLPEASAGVPFPAGPLAVLDAVLDPATVRRLAFTSEPMAPRAAREAGVVDDCAPRAGAEAAARARLADLRAQPAFVTVKDQLRGALRARLDALVENAADPHLPAFL